MHAVDFSIANERPDFRFRQRRVTDPLGPGGIGEPLGEVPRNAPVGEDALNRYADLAGMIETALGDGGYGQIEIGIGRENERRDAAVLQRAACSRRQLRTQHPADPRAADEGEERHSGIRHERLRGGVTAGHQGLGPRGRQACLAKDLDEPEAGQRRVLGWLNDHRTTRRDRGRRLVDDQIQRMVEGTDGDGYAPR